MENVRMELERCQFHEKEKTILQSGGLTASSFLYPSGVCALRLKNERGELIVLPFQGQQIWRASFCGRDLVMKSSFDQPAATTDYLATYGGFLLHCGATAMGVPSAKDSHPLHGELPNIAYNEAWLTVGEDQDGRYLSLSGKLDYRVAFSTHYTAEPEIKLYAGATTARIAMKLTNLRSKPMDYMYLCHINFRPVDGARLVYSAPADAGHVHAHRVVPDTMPAAEAAALGRYIDQINQDPQVHHKVDPKTQIYDPEIVMTIRFEADKQGYAHTMQVLPEGGAFYVSHRVAELPLGLRWIARTVDEDAMGMVLPATAEHFGQADARERGMLKTLAAGQSVTMSMVAGYLEAAEAAKIEALIS